jgi:hypothetical protein
MKITKNQLRKLIREELQSERITVGATPEETAANVAAVHGPGGAFAGKQDADLFKELDNMVTTAKGIRSPMDTWAPKVLDQIADLLSKRQRKG